jgi:hypothetical protein
MPLYGRVLSRLIFRPPTQTNKSVFPRHRGASSSGAIIMFTASAYAIEVHGEAAGIVVSEGNRYVFFASNWAYRDLDRRTFRGVSHAENAARDIDRRQRRMTAARA